MIHKTEQLQFEDYKVLVKSLYANAQAVQVYGGEDVSQRCIRKSFYIN